MFPTNNLTFLRIGLLKTFNNKEFVRVYSKLNYVIKSKEPECLPALQYSTGYANNYQVYSWGLAEHGALGLTQSKEKPSHRYMQKPIRHFFSEKNDVINVKCGFGFSLFYVKSDDCLKLFGSGINTDSQIGYHDPRLNHPLELILSPAPIDLGLRNSETLIYSISAGRAHTTVVTDNEGVLTLGSNCYGQCGRPVIEEEKYKGSSFVHSICKLDGELIIDAVCGQDHTLFLTEKRKVFSCGWGADGQLGLGTFCDSDIPKKVCGDIESEVILKLAGKSDCVLALNENGEVFGWGNNEYHQLGPESMGQLVATPQKLTILEGIGKIIDIAAGSSFCMALNEDGDVFCWGYGILGCGPEVMKSAKPLKIPRSLFGCNEYQPDAKVTAIFCGISHCTAINNYFNLYTWGKNRSGCLGLGHVRDQYFPYKVPLTAQVTHVDCGFDHTMALCKPFC